MIQVERFSKNYGDNIAVDDLSFAVDSGEILGLVGPNGAGKTTTLRALAGIFPPSSGRLLVSGHDIVKEPIQAKRCLAFVPDDPNLFESLTVWEHLDFTARIYKLDAWRDRAESLLADLEMDEQKTKLADELSRGMRQKVAAACALLHEPRILLLDEPLTGLDPRGIRTFYEAVKQCATGGAAVIVSSHLLSQIEGLCSSFLIIRQGKRLFLGSKEAIRAELPSLSEDATLEEIFFRATEEQETGSEGPILS